jgi:hypothetical protein
MTVPLPQVPAGDSAVQRAAETKVLALLSARIGVRLQPASIPLGEGTRVDVDAVSGDPPVIAEIWAHQGPPKSAQRNKVLTDVLKLAYVEAVKGEPHRKILCFTDAAAAKPFSAKTWYAGALKYHRIEVVVVDIPDELRSEILEAQKRQYR